MLESALVRFALKRMLCLGGAMLGCQHSAVLRCAAPSNAFALSATVRMCVLQEQECVQREPAVRAALSKMYRSGKNTGVLHDMKCTGAMHPLSSDVIKVGPPLSLRPSPPPSPLPLTPFEISY